MHFYLVIGVKRRKGGMILSQHLFVSKIIELAGLQDAKPAPTPLPVSDCLYEFLSDVSD